MLFYPFTKMENHTTNPHVRLPLVAGLPVEARVHCYPGSPAGHAGRLLAHAVGAEHTQHRHAYQVYREGQGRCSPSRKTVFDLT